MDALANARERATRYGLGDPDRTGRVIWPPQGLRSDRISVPLPPPHGKIEALSVAGLATRFDAGNSIVVHNYTSETDAGQSPLGPGPLSLCLHSV